MPKSIKDRKAELEAQLAKITEQEKQEEATRHALLGAVVEKSMKDDVDLNRKIGELLESTLTKKADRAIFELTPLPTNKGRPNTKTENNEQS